MTYRIFTIGLLIMVTLPPTLQPAFGQDSYYVPRSHFDNMGIVYTSTGKTPLELREVWIHAPGNQTPRHLSLLVMFEPVSGAFSWRAMYLPVPEEVPWQSQDAKNIEGAFLKDGELIDFRAIDMRLIVHSYRGHASNMNEAVRKSLKAAKVSLEPLKDMDKAQGLHTASLLPLTRDFGINPMSSAPSGVTTKVLDVQWDGKHWSLLLEARWKARVVLDADYNLISSTKVE